MTSATVVLVHGGGGSPAMWDEIVAGLDERGIGAVAADLPTMQRPDATLADDVNHVRELVAQTGATILCGHSYGGIPITEAGAGLAGLRHLVYLAALMPDIGESGADWGGKRYLEPPLPVDFREDGTMLFRAWIVPDSDKYYGPAELERIAKWPPPRPFATGAATTPLTGAAWREIPSTYVVATRDRSCHPDTQREMAARATHAIEMDCQHLIMVAYPDRIIDLMASLAAREN